MQKFECSLKFLFQGCHFFYTTITQLNWSLLIYSVRKNGKKTNNKNEFWPGRTSQVQALLKKKTIKSQLNWRLLIYRVRETQEKKKTTTKKEFQPGRTCKTVFFPPPQKNPGQKLGQKNQNFFPVIFQMYRVRPVSRTPIHLVASSFSVSAGENLRNFYDFLRNSQESQKFLACSQKFPEKPGNC